MLGRMAGVTHLVPARFLCIIAHLVVIIVVFWSRDAHIRASLPQSYAQTDYDNIDNWFLAGLIMTVIFICMELGGFMSGVTMFANVESLFSTAAHASASIALSFFLFEVWASNTFWFIFAACSALPAVIDTGLIISKVFFTKSS